MARKMDPKLISGEKHEVAYLAKKLKVPQKLIRLARETAGRSRVKVTAFVLGYTLSNEGDKVKIRFGRRKR